MNRPRLIWNGLSNFISCHKKVQFVCHKKHSRLDWSPRVRERQLPNFLICAFKALGHTLLRWCIWWCDGNWQVFCSLLNIIYCFAVKNGLKRTSFGTGTGRCLTGRGKSTSSCQSCRSNWTRTQASRPCWTIPPTTSSLSTSPWYLPSWESRVTGGKLPC